MPLCLSVAASTGTCHSHRLPTRSPPLVTGPGSLQSRPSAPQQLWGVGGLESTRGDWPWPEHRSSLGISPERFVASSCWEMGLPGFGIDWSSEVGVADISPRWKAGPTLNHNLLPRRRTVTHFRSIRFPLTCPSQSPLLPPAFAREYPAWAPCCLSPADGRARHVKEAALWGALCKGAAVSPSPACTMLFLLPMSSL